MQDDTKMSHLECVTPRRDARPERIDIGNDILVRNDVIAAKQGTSTRTIDRGDALGAPYTYVGGVKYRPENAYNKFLASRIKQAVPPRRKAR